MRRFEAETIDEAADIVRSLLLDGVYPVIEILDDRSGLGVIVITTKREGNQ